MTSIDGDGWTLLAAMKEAGAVFITEGVGMKQLIEEMLEGGSLAKNRTLLARPVGAPGAGSSAAASSRGRRKPRQRRRSCA